MLIIMCTFWSTLPISDTHNSSLLFTSYFSFLHALGAPLPLYSFRTLCRPVFLISLCSSILTVFCFPDYLDRLIRTHSINCYFGNKWCQNLNLHLLCHCFILFFFFKLSNTWNAGRVSESVSLLPNVNHSKQSTTLTLVIFLKHKSDHITSLHKFF